MIQATVSTICLHDWGLTLPEILQSYAATGFRRVELVAVSADFQVDIETWDAARLRDFLAPSGLALAAIYPKVLNVHDPIEYEHSLKYTMHCIDLAAALGCGRIVFTPLLPRQDYNYDLLISGLKRLADYIGSRPVVVCLENHHNWPLSYPEDYRRVFDQIDDPRIGITMDTGFFTASQVDHLKFIDTFYSRLYHIHIKDHIAFQSVAIGKGQTPLKAIFADLHARGFNGLATVEMEVEDKANMPRYMTEALAYCRDELKITI